jgi:hypothetical protein
VPLAVPYCTARCPFDKSAISIPANVRYSAGLPAAVTCAVNPLYAGAPCPPAQSIEKRWRISRWVRRTRTPSTCRRPCRRRHGLLPSAQHQPDGCHLGFTDQRADDQATAYVSSAVCSASFTNLRIALICHDFPQNRCHAGCWRVAVLPRCEVPYSSRRASDIGRFALRAICTMRRCGYTPRSGGRIAPAAG